MAGEVIAILYPGDMGHGVGRALGEHGHRVITSLEGRSEGSRARAERANMQDVGDLRAVVSEAELILSIMPPESALATSREVAAAMGVAGKTPTYADCNAVSPETTQDIGRVMANVGAAYIDGGIIGNAPGAGKLPTRFFVSGPDTSMLRSLDGKGIDVRDCGAEIGRAGRGGSVERGRNRARGMGL